VGKAQRRAVEPQINSMYYEAYIIPASHWKVHFLSYLYFQQISFLRDAKYPPFSEKSSRCSRYLSWHLEHSNRQHQWLHSKFLNTRTAEMGIWKRNCVWVCALLAKYLHAWHATHLSVSSNWTCFWIGVPGCSCRKFRLSQRHIQRRFLRLPFPHLWYR
jgi:hypothetical protein